MFESPPNKIKSIPRYQREDAAWGHSKTYELIKSGICRLCGSVVVSTSVMASHRKRPKCPKGVTGLR